MSLFVLTRLLHTDLSTAGEITDGSGNLICKSLERGLKNPDHLRIPAGTYQLGRGAIGQSEFDHAFTELLGSAYKGTLQVRNVPGRTAIEIHTANWYTQLRGCVATGRSVVLGDDGHYQVPFGMSKLAYADFYRAASDALAAGSAFLKVVDNDHEQQGTPA